MVGVTVPSVLSPSISCSSIHGQPSSLTPTLNNVSSDDKKLTFLTVGLMLTVLAAVISVQVGLMVFATIQGRKDEKNKTSDILQHAAAAVPMPTGKCASVRVCQTQFWS